MDAELTDTLFKNIKRITAIEIIELKSPRSPFVFD